MKIRIPFAVAFTALLIYSCDEPVAYNNDLFTYNPFSFTEDTLNNVLSLEAGASDIEWGSHFRAWVGDTDYYKSGFSVDFVFSDTTLDIVNVDSIQFQLKHVKTYAQNGSDTIATSLSAFGFYETTDQIIDIGTSAYGSFLGNDSMNISGGDDFWNFTLPAETIVEGDTSIGLGIFPLSMDYFSALYGGGSGSRPALTFFYHEQDTAGNDSATFRSFLADTLLMSMAEKSTAFDHTQFEYLSQLRSDSLVYTFDLLDLEVGGDTLQHAIISEILPAIDQASSSLYKPDTSFSFSIVIEEPESGLTKNIEYNGSSFSGNEIKQLLQSAIDEKAPELQLILRPTNPGYNPGFIAISKDISQSALYVKTSLAVKP